jgi:hypothetical protein
MYVPLASSKANMIRATKATRRIGLLHAAALTSWVCSASGLIGAIVAARLSYLMEITSNSPTNDPVADQGRTALGHEGCCQTRQRQQPRHAANDGEHLERNANDKPVASSFPNGSRHCNATLRPRATINP